MDAIVSMDEEHRIVQFNAAAEKMFGCAREDAIGQPLDRFIPARHRVAHRRQIEEFEKAGRTTRAMGRLGAVYGLRGNGEEFPIESAISQVAAGDKKYFTAVLRDITVARRAEEELRRREEYFRSLIEYASDLITVVDSAGAIQFQSPSVERILELKAPEMAGRNLAEFIHSDDVPRVTSMIRRALVNPDAPVSLECRVRHRDGSWRLLAAVGRSIPGERDGRRVVFNSRDITASRNLEEQFLQAQKMEAIGTLAGGIAHDFNNMLAAILGSVELLREDLGPDHFSQEHVESIVAAAHRARELVQRILTFSRRTESERQLLQLQPLAAECIKLLRSTIPAMVKITHHLEGNCPPVLADPTQIHQVIMNMATNSWHALPETGGLIDISLRSVEVDAAMTARHRELRPGQYVRLTVSDNGHGMDPMVRERIFEPFFTTKPASKGSGLGLSVVHGIIKSHRGSILVESEPGKGTTFHVYLPAKMANRRETASPTLTIPHGRGERILLVDDEPIVGRSGEQMLKRLGYVVTRCEQAEDALDRFRRAPEAFDMIITDWAMPGMSGTELVSAIQEVRPDMPMVLMSGFVGALAENTARMMRNGEVLVKPVNPELFAQTVAGVLSRAIRKAR
ncbi:MAG TPA: PAS domain S-box protein [Verrucomicrobiae bacterium]|nr:PAS domain S-box protein [Verrucomicrobiae bacterium]